MTDFLDIHGMVDLQELPYKTIEVGMQDFPTMTINEIDFWDPERMPYACVRLVEGQVLEEFMLEENINFQGRDQNVELPNKQKVDREMVVWPNLSVETPYEQEIRVEMKTCNMSLPELFKAKESVHTNEIELDIPLEQDKSNLHTKQKKVLGSKVIRRANPTKLVKRKICRPLQNHLIY